MVFGLYGEVDQPLYRAERRVTEAVGSCCRWFADESIRRLLQSH